MVPQRLHDLCRQFLAIGAVCVFCSLARGQETADYFRQNCASCHTIGGGRLTGPDLKNVTKSKDAAGNPVPRQWFINFILDPKGVIDSGDSYALKLFEEANGQIMTKAFGITRDRAERLLDLIEAESKLPKSQFAGLQISARPLTDKDVEIGREYFLGLRRFTNGGPACVSCHTVRGLGGLGGGRLGPNLSDPDKAPTVQKGRKALASWLAAPATPTMVPIYKRHPLVQDAKKNTEEILSLVAFLENSAEKGRARESVAQINFFLLGLGGAVLGLVLCAVIWKRRFRGVRKRLVQQSADRIHSGNVGEKESAVA